MQNTPNKKLKLAAAAVVPWNRHRLWQHGSFESDIGTSLYGWKTLIDSNQNERRKKHRKLEIKSEKTEKCEDRHNWCVQLLMMISWRRAGRSTHIQFFCVLFFLVCRMLFVTEYTEKQSAPNTWELQRLLLIIVEYIVWSARESRRRGKEVWERGKIGWAAAKKTHKIHSLSSFTVEVRWK